MNITEIVLIIIIVILACALIFFLLKNRNNKFRGGGLSNGIFKFDAVDESTDIFPKLMSSETVSEKLTGYGPTQIENIVSALNKHIFGDKNYVNSFYKSILVPILRMYSFVYCSTKSNISSNRNCMLIDKDIDNTYLAKAMYYLNKFDPKEENKIVKAANGILKSYSSALTDKLTNTEVLENTYNDMYKTLTKSDTVDKEIETYDIGSFHSKYPKINVFAQRYFTSFNAYKDILDILKKKYAITKDELDYKGISDAYAFQGLGMDVGNSSKLSFSGREWYGSYLYKGLFSIPYGMTSNDMYPVSLLKKAIVVIAILKLEIKTDESATSIDEKVKNNKLTLMNLFTKYRINVLIFNIMVNKPLNANVNMKFANTFYVV